MEEITRWLERQAGKVVSEGRVRRCVGGWVYEQAMDQQASDSLCLILFYRIITDGPMSATVFNGPTPLYDALYTSASNFITGTVTGLMVDSPSVPDTVNHISTTTHVVTKLFTPCVCLVVPIIRKIVAH